MATRQARLPVAGSSTSAPLLTETKKRFTLTDIATNSIPLPNRYGFHAGQGFGKTSLAAYTPKPIFIQTRGETGLNTLIDAGQLPPTPHFPEATNWDELTSAIQVLREQDHDYKTLVIDTLNGAERMMHEFVCERDFDGDWGDKGFMSFMRGYEVSLADWRLFLNSLDELRREKKMTIFCLLHSRIKTFKNPAGADYDRYVPEMHDKTWGLTKGWLDCILFGNFEVTVKNGNKVADSSKKGKVSEISTRILYTNSDNPVYDAKNRLGLPDEIEMGDDGQEAWKNLVTAIKNGRKTEKEEEAK